jgi:hypothetical protein
MNKTKYVLLGAVALVLTLLILRTFAAETADASTAVEEYATIRWGGRENTCLIRPSGRVEFLAPVLSKYPRPDRVDDRSYYMSIALNAAAKEGFEFAGMTNDEIVMKRRVPR